MYVKTLGGTLLQRTLRQPIVFDGVGLHCGEPVRASLRPAVVDHGIVFVRTDLAGSPRVPASLDTVVSTTLATTLGRGDATVSTVEHLIAALSGLGVDNVLIEVDGPEVPVMDGSARPFVEAIEGAGVVDQRAARRLLRVVEPVRIDDPDQDRWSCLEPWDGFVVDCSISFDHPLLRDQRCAFDGDPRRFAEGIAPARTFGLLADVESMRAAGFARGGGLDNAVVFGATEVINPGGLRFTDECARHKLLDMIGDLGLLGAPVIGRFRAHRSGHELNLRLVREAVRCGAIVPEIATERSMTASG